jgi:membrane associated rhomboid family serine protease
LIPLRDENPSGSIARVTIGLIALNSALFVYELLLGSGLRDFMMQWGLVPERITLALQFGGEPIAPTALTLLTSMFLHGGWAHLIGNMWYLWIFGDNIEDRLGHARYLAFYLAGGLVAAVVQYLTQPGSGVPTVGASGAIAAVLGAYAVTFPRARVVTLIPLFPFFPIVRLSALVVLGLWFVLQFFSGALSLAWGGRGGGVAWWAHIGGFAFGMIAMRLLAPRRRPSFVERVDPH